MAAGPGGGRPSVRAGGRGTAALALLGTLLVVALLVWLRSGSAAPASGSAGPSTGAGTSAGAVASSTVVRTTSGHRSTTPPAPDSLQAKALAVLAVVDATGGPPSGYVGGRQFMNDGRGGTSALPATDRSGKRIVYHEYDVNPYHQGVNRGPQRLVVGSDGSAYVTGDHYVTWIRLR
jgi:guanyl-specific ribonuclease Sa